MRITQITKYELLFASKLLVFGVLLLLLQACNKRCGDSKTTGGVLIDLRVPAAFNGSLIETEQAYLSLFEQRNATDTPFIDFSKHCLIGIQTSAGGCDFGFINKLSIDHNKKEYLYEVSIQSCGKCKMLVTSDNWMVADKKPHDYKMIFKTN